MSKQITEITLLGATGSIGRSTLDVVSRYPDRYRIFAITANTNVELSEKLCEQWSPQYAVMNDAASAKRLRDSLQAKDIATTVLEGNSGLLKVVEH